ncbi:hypothetical protein PISMIDRAFT_19808 [Pisolithus microcarpus 441]|uniref:CCHC-type domain-containing protein n=1 Tax=Pisolithus microcarpus 441 TaxID=765257 RepID=A0A0C9YLB5_9AGAM|nr:hypothetical protein PISMIDRAFT_19808 [Pisolithus microcarpus 441]
MIGKTDEGNKAYKFWFGLRKELQSELWKEKLNPEVSSLREIVSTAEILEIAQSVMGGHNWRPRRHRSRKCTSRRTEVTPEDDRPSHHWKKRHHRKRDKHSDQPKEPTPSGSGQHQKRDKNSGKRKTDSPRLSKEDQERHKAKGLCYICHKSGHFSRNCPDRQKVTSSGKPPGVTSFGVDVDFGDVEQQRHLAKESEHEPGVSLNFIHTRGPTVNGEDGPDDTIPDLESVWSDQDDDDRSDNDVTTDESDPFGGMRIHFYESGPLQGPLVTGPQIGTPLADRAMEHLSGICYPGDDPDSLATYMDTRFVIYDLHDG